MLPLYVYNLVSWTDGEEQTLSQSLRRRPMKVDHEVSRLADRIRESLMFVDGYEDGKGQGSTIVAN